MQLAHTKQEQKQKKQTNKQTKIRYKKPNRKEQKPRGNSNSSHKGTEQMAEGPSPLEGSNFNW